MHKGDFGRYLARIGRMDLVRAAQEALSQTDPDIALQNFLSSLPGSQAQGLGPRLDLNPRRLMLGVMRPAVSAKLTLRSATKARDFFRAKSASAKAKTGSRSKAWRANANCPSRRREIRT